MDDLAWSDADIDRPAREGQNIRPAAWANWSV